MRWQGINKLYLGAHSSLQMCLKSSHYMSSNHHFDIMLCVHHVSVRLEKRLRCVSGIQAEWRESGRHQSSIHGRDTSWPRKYCQQRGGVSSHQAPWDPGRRTCRQHNWNIQRRGLDHPSQPFKAVKAGKQRSLGRNTGWCREDRGRGWGTKVCTGERACVSNDAGRSGPRRADLGIASGSSTGVKTSWLKSKMEKRHWKVTNHIIFSPRCFHGQGKRKWE